MHEKENVQSEINWTVKEKGGNGGGIGMGQKKAVFACQSLMGEKWANKRVRNSSVFETRDRCEPLYVWRYHVKVVFMAWVCLNCCSVFLLWHLLLYKSQRLIIVVLMSSCNITYPGNLGPSSFTNDYLRNTHRLIENRLVVAGGEGGMEWELAVHRCKLLHIEWINSKVLLYSTGNYNYIQYPETNHNGKEHEKEYISIYINIHIYIYV